jgi:hypothetical protein
VCRAAGTANSSVGTRKICATLHKHRESKLVFAHGRRNWTKVRFVACPDWPIFLRLALATAAANHDIGRITRLEGNACGQMPALGQKRSFGQCPPCANGGHSEAVPPSLSVGRRRERCRLLPRETLTNVPPATLGQSAPEPQCNVQLAFRASQPSGEIGTPLAAPSRTAGLPRVKPGTTVDLSARPLSARRLCYWGLTGVGLTGVDGLVPMRSDRPVWRTSRFSWRHPARELSPLALHSCLSSLATWRVDRRSSRRCMPCVCAWAGRA